VLRTMLGQAYFIPVPPDIRRYFPATNGAQAGSSSQNHRIHCVKFLFGPDFYQ
jgi:hypothetical protein